MLLLPKTIGPLTLLRKLGSGGVSETFSGRYEGEPPREVIARRILPYVLQDAGRRAAVEVRVKDLLAVRHPSVVESIEWLADGDDRYLVEARVEGLDLERLITWCRHHDLTIPPTIFLHLATQMCNALETLNGRPGKSSGVDHILHHGLCPGAVHVTPEGRVVLGGAALTRSPTSLPQGGLSGAVPERMEYLSPEQTHPDQRLTPASDVFSLAAVLYELLTLEPLFRDRSAHITVNNIRRAEVGEAMLRAKELVPNIDRILARALSLNPKHRYQRAFVLREDLRGLMAGWSFANINQDTEAFLRPMFEGSLAVVPPDRMPVEPDHEVPEVVDNYELGPDYFKEGSGFEDEVPTRIEDMAQAANPEAETERASELGLGPLLTEESDEYELFSGPILDDMPGLRVYHPEEGGLDDPELEDEDHESVPPPVHRERRTTTAPWLRESLPSARVPRPSAELSREDDIPTLRPRSPIEDLAPPVRRPGPSVGSAGPTLLPRVEPDEPEWTASGFQEEDDEVPPADATWPPPEPRMGESPSTGWYAIGKEAQAAPAVVEEDFDSEEITVPPSDPPPELAKLTPPAAPSIAPGPKVVASLAEPDSEIPTESPTPAPPSSPPPPPVSAPPRPVMAAPPPPVAAPPVMAPPPVAAPPVMAPPPVAPPPPAAPAEEWEEAEESGNGLLIAGALAAAFLGVLCAGGALMFFTRDKGPEPVAAVEEPIVEDVEPAEITEDEAPEIKAPEEAPPEVTARTAAPPAEAPPARTEPVASAPRESTPSQAPRESAPRNSSTSNPSPRASTPRSEPRTTTPARTVTPVAAAPA
ncbi:MAG: protein kinase, partial [Alphaproteobacteria bacterium]|nr:protein kinase [Alphaproteobacteria bacterium]